MPTALRTTRRSLDLECNSLDSLDALKPLWSLPRLAELRLRGNLLPLAAYRRASEGGAPPSRRKYAPYPAAVVEGHADSSEYLPFAEAQAGRGGAAALAEAAERGSEHRAAPPPKYPGHYLPPAAPEAGL